MAGVDPAFVGSVFNALPLDRSPYGPDKLTTMALGALSSGQLEYRLVRKRSAPTE